MKDFPEARRGQELTPAMWNAARAFVRANQLREGNGIRLHTTPDGTFISADTGGAPWNHPFRVFVSGNSANILPGLVNASVEPEIEDVPLSGDDKNPPPRLEWSRLKLDKEGRGYIALEAEFDAKWLVAPHKVKVVQVAYLDSENGEDPPANSGGKSGAGGVPLLPRRRSRWGLAMLRQRKSGRLDVIQCAHGDLQVRAQPRNSAVEEGRAFWW